MKILVVSLLRLGDIIQQEPLLRGLKEKHPEAQIHLLLNRQFASIEKLLVGVVDRYFYFDRENLQKGLGEAAYNILWSYSELEKLVQILNEQHYDKAYNFTHNKLSAHLLGALEIPEKKGLHHSQGRFSGIESKWMRYFNDRFSGTQKSLFHYVEILGKAFDIPTPRKAQNQKKRSKLVLMQCLTSDSKKNWGLQNFLQLKESIEKNLVDYEVCILGASFERETLAKYFAESDLLICDLNEARRHLQNAALLISGDTSIKHLAAQLGTPVVEIAIGSSDPVKTAAFTQNAHIVSTTVPCAPCTHSQACHQSSHLCAEEIKVDQVFSAVWDALGGEKVRADNVLLAMERLTWSLYLDGNPLNHEASIKEFVTTHGLPAVKAAFSEWDRRNTYLLTTLVTLTHALPTRESFAQRKQLQASDLSELILYAQDILKSKKDVSGYFTDFVESLLTKFTQPVQLYDRIAKAIDEAKELIQIRTHITQFIELQSMEGNYYAAGIGKLSISGFEETGTSVHRDHQDAKL